MVLTDDTVVLYEEIPRKVYDIVIIYADEDKELAAEFRNHLVQDVFADGRTVSVKLHTDTCFTSMDDTFGKCAFAFMYLTKSFCEKFWNELSREVCVISSLYNRNKTCRVIPVMTENPLDANFRIPMGINALKPVKLYNKDELYRESIIRLLSESPRLSKGG